MNQSPVPNPGVFAPIRRCEYPYFSLGTPRKYGLLWIRFAHLCQAVFAQFRNSSEMRWSPCPVPGLKSPARGEFCTRLCNAERKGARVSPAGEGRPVQVAVRKSGSAGRKGWTSGSVWIVEQACERGIVPTQELIQRVKIQQEKGRRLPKALTVRVGGPVPGAGWVDLPLHYW